VRGIREINSLRSSAIIAAEMNEANKQSKSAYTLPACPSNCQAWHSINQVAAMLSVGRCKVYQLMKEGRLRFVDRDIGRRVRHEWIAEYSLSNVSGRQDRAGLS
jgi:excisionase family DNA binding protein